MHIVLELTSKLLFSKRAQSVVRRISWITLLALAVSTASLIVVLSVMTALNQNVQNRSLAVEPHITVVGAKPDELLKLIPNELIFPFDAQDLIARAPGGRFRGGLGRGLTPDGFAHLRQQMEQLNRNSNYREDLIFPGEGEVILGLDLAHALGVFEGESILLLSPESLLLPPDETPIFEKVRVLRVVNFRIADLDSQGIFFLSGRTATRFSDSASRRSGSEIWLHDPTSASKIKESLSKHNSKWSIQTWQERNSALYFALRLEKLMISLFLGAAGFLAGFSLVSVLGLLISQKKKEIGVLMALGQSQVRLKRIFTWLGFGLGMAGVLVGTLVGSAISIYLEFYPLDLLPEVYVDSRIPARLDPLLILRLLFFSSLFALSISALASRSAIASDSSESFRV